MVDINLSVFGFWLMIAVWIAVHHWREVKMMQLGLKRNLKRNL